MQQIQAGRAWSSRDKQGRFAAGNPYALMGWQGLVNRRFAGDVVAAKEWVGQLGRYAYGRNYWTPGKGYPCWVKGCSKTHPGTPEAFHVNWNPRLSFTLADVPEKEF